jgi:hypothetical protein
MDSPDGGRYTLPVGPKRTWIGQLRGLFALKAMEAKAMRRWSKFVVRALLALSLFAIFNGTSDCYGRRSEPPGYQIPE